MQSGSHWYRAAADHFDFREQRGECARIVVDLPVPRSPSTSTPPIAWIDGGDCQRALHVVLTDDSGKWISGTHACPLLRLRGSSATLIQKVWIKDYPHGCQTNYTTTCQLSLMVIPWPSLCACSGRGTICLFAQRGSDAQRLSRRGHRGSTLWCSCTASMRCPARWKCARSLSTTATSGRFGCPICPALGSRIGPMWPIARGLYARWLAEWLESLEEPADDGCRLSLTGEFMARAILEQGVKVRSLSSHFAHRYGCPCAAVGAKWVPRGSFLSSPWVGHRCFAVLTSKPSIRWFLGQAFVGYDTRAYGALRARDGESAGSHFAPIKFLTFSLFTEQAITRLLQSARSCPALVLYDRIPILVSSACRADRGAQSLGCKAAIAQPRITALGAADRND